MNQGSNGHRLSEVQETPTERSCAVELNMQKYAPLLRQAGIPEASYEWYLRELAGAVHSILDSYFQDLEEGLNE